MLKAIIVTIAGLWIAVTPFVFGMNKAVSDYYHIIGPLIITFAVIAFWEINRNVIKVNILTGASLLTIPIFFNIESSLTIVLTVLSGILIIILSLLPNKKRKHNYGGGWVSLFQDNPPHMQDTVHKKTD